MTKRTKKPNEFGQIYFTRSEVRELNAIAARALAETLGISEEAAKKLLRTSNRKRQRHRDDDVLDDLEFLRSQPRFFDKGFRLVRASNRSRHRIGGHLQSPPPLCAICNTPLVLFINLDATDKRLRGDHALSRLPLYYCCSCPGPVHYSINSVGRVTVLRSKPELYDECPFESPPPTIPAGYLAINEISDTADEALVAGHRTEDFRSLDKSQLKLIRSVLGRTPRGRWDLYFSQLGGFPNSFQGGEGMPDRCPNPSCPNRRRRKDEHMYRPLAVLDLWNDRFWRIKRTDAVQIVFNICPGCFSIAAKYTCT